MIVIIVYIFIKGVLRFGLDRGVPLELQNPYPSLRVIVAKRVPFVTNFSWKIDPFFTNFVIFQVFTMRKPKNLGSVRKLDHV